MSDAEHVPAWVPEIAPGVRADVYPVEPPRQTREPYCDSPPELVLDRHAVTAGYSERRLPYEFGSCLPAAVTAASAPPLSSAVPGSQPPPPPVGLSSADLSKLRTGIAQLRRSRPTKLQRVEQHVFTPPPKPANSDSAAYAAQSTSLGSKKAFPLQKPSGSSSLEDWFNKLSSGANFNTSELSRSVPLGPAIVRAAGKVIEMMATRAVPTQRAAWYIRIAVLNECVKQIRPDRPPPSPRIFWTRQLCNLLKTDLEAIRQRKTAMLGSMDRVAFWDYVLDLARWQADEGLLDCTQWMTRITSLLRHELSSSQSFNSPGTKITMSAARRFLAEFLSSPANARQLLEAVLPGASTIVKAWRSASTAQSAKTDANGSSAQSKGNAKTGSRRGSIKRTQFIPNLCHRKVTTLLSALVRFLDDSVPSTAESETRMSDLERFVKRGVNIVLKMRNQESSDSSRSNERAGPGQPLSSSKDARREIHPSTHHVMRELDMLPGHGDVSRVVLASLKSFEERGGVGAAVKQICSWAMEGPSSDRDESICVAVAVIYYLARSSTQTNGNGTGNALRVMNQDIHRPQSGLEDPTWTPALQREIWHFLKEHSKELKPADLEENSALVKFIAHACRVELLSLRVLVRDISRLSSHGHPGSAYLVKCLSLLPGPVDLTSNINDSSVTASLDCRRPLLRKHGYITSSRGKQESPVDERFTRGVLSSDMSTMRLATEDLRKSDDLSTILSTTEFVRLRNLWQELDGSSTLVSRLHETSSFLLRLDGPGPAVLWLLGNLGEVLDGAGPWASPSSAQKRNDVIMELVRLVEDVSRYLAANGVLEHAFDLLKRAWLSSWISPGVRRRILLSAAALAKHFASDASSSLYWSKMVTRNLRQKSDGATAAKLFPLALAGLRGTAEGSSSPDLSLEDLFNSSRREVFASPEEDLLLSMSRVELHGVSVNEVRSFFASSENSFSVDDLFDKGFTMNDIFGTVILPVLVETLEEPLEDSGDESSFSRLALSALQTIADRQHDVRLQGVRPMVLVEFIALIATGCLSGHTDASASLEVLVQTSWFWKVLAPKAGIGLAKRIRSRMDHYCEKIGEIDNTVVSALLFNMVVRFSGDENREEPAVCSALGTDPFGMIDMQLALLATHRHESGEDEEFGARICDAAVALICVDLARTLATGVLRSCVSEEAKQVVAGLVGYGAVQAMAESLGFVVKGLTVEAPKNSQLHQVRAIQWYQADRARRVILECVVGSLSQEVGVQVEAVLFDQLGTVTSLLNMAISRNCMPSSLLEDGRRISDALESRLFCILKSQRTPQGAETWKQRTIQIATLLQCTVPLMKTSAIKAGTDTLVLCLKNLGACEVKPDETQAAPKTIAQVIDSYDDGGLRQQLRDLLLPVLLWVGEPEQKAIARILEESSNPTSQNANVIRARNSFGSDIDNWVLLEGYGRGPDEDAAIPPTAFGKQGAGTKADIEKVIQLKRTYSTFSSLAV